MKNAIVKFSLTVLAAFTLAACGSSGGSSDNAAAASHDQKTQVTPSKTDLPTSNSTEANQNQTFTGAALVVSGLYDNMQVKNVKFNNANINQLEVDGQKITLTYPGIYAGSWQRVNNTAVCCGKYANVRMGVSLSNGPTEKDILFYNGAPTQNMPVTGLASYKGDSIILSDDISDDSDEVAGQSSFDVDFGAKTLSGSITANNAPTINVSANISGNSFEGTAKSTKLTDGAVEGKFYGNNAVELGGLAKANDNSWGAGFVGKKQ